MIELTNNFVVFIGNVYRFEVTAFAILHTPLMSGAPSPASR